jgi:hypothetical protein
VTLSPRYLLLTCLLAGGCSSDAGPEQSCPRTPAAFHVLIRAANGVLPDDTVVSVRYGGSAVEQYYVSDPPSEPEVLFCKAVDNDGGPPGVGDASPPPFQEIEALACDLWTNGAAIVTVAASRYPVVERQLEPHTDHCGVSETVQAEIMLGEPDGGA